MLARNAPQAILTRGEAAWRDSVFGPTTNASKAALFDELTLAVLANKTRQRQARAWCPRPRHEPTNSKTADVPSATVRCAR